MHAPIVTPPPPELSARENAHINATLARLALVREVCADATLAPVLRDATLPLWEEELEAEGRRALDAEGAEEQAVDDLNEEREKRHDAESRARQLEEALSDLLATPDNAEARRVAIKLLGGAHPFWPSRRSGLNGLCRHCKRPETHPLHA